MESDLLRYIHFTIQAESLPNELQLPYEINQLLEVSRPPFISLLTSLRVQSQATVLRMKRKSE
jgi:hypothetical protein